MLKTCFIITPIEQEFSPTRKRVDQWMEHIYKPALSEEFYLLRADKIGAPGGITEQILDQLIHAELSVIDYTDLNPNVLYEAAIRHISQKSVIQIYPSCKFWHEELAHFWCFRLLLGVPNLLGVPEEAWRMRATRL